MPPTRARGGRFFGSVLRLPATLRTDLRTVLDTADKPEQPCCSRSPNCHVCGGRRSRVPFGAYKASHEVWRRRTSGEGGKLGEIVSRPISMRRRTWLSFATPTRLTSTWVAC